MTFKEYYNEAVICKPIWIDSVDHKSRVLNVTGIASFYDNQGNENNALVDASIAPLIDLMNKKGFKTWVSCSGLPEDHSGDDFHITGASAYIGFNSRDIKILQPIFQTAGFERITDKSAYMYHDTIPTSARTRRVWNKLYKLIKALP